MAQIKKSDPKKGSASKQNAVAAKLVKAFNSSKELRDAGLRIEEITFVPRARPKAQ